MQNKKKGFTLIELLAVIVILAIIALIAVPVIMNVIGNARKSAFEDSAYGIVKAGEVYYSNKLLDAQGMTENKEFTITNGAFVGEALEVSGSLPSSGKVTVTSDGKVAVALINGEYCVRKATTESKIQAEKLSDLNGACDYKTAATPVFTKATGETSVPACITNNTTCTAGTKVGVKVNDNQTYDFYVMSEDASEGTITLIMNQNLGETVAWISKDDYISAGGTEANWGYGNINKGPITALKALEERTSSWTNIPSKLYELIDDNYMGQLYPTMTRMARVRMIKREEVVVLLSLDNHGWLFGNYWLSTTSDVGPDVAPAISSNGSLSDDGIYDSTKNGIRPVITIPKTTI